VLDEVNSEEEREVSVIEEDALGGEHVEVAGDGTEDAEYEEGVVVDGLAEGDGDKGADIPLPNITDGERERKQLIEEQTRDESLKELRQWAEKGEKGYTIDNGLLVHRNRSVKGSLFLAPEGLSC
jgi:hypothetical protein